VHTVQRKFVSFVVVLIFLLALVPVGNTSNPYTVYISVYLDDQPVNGANVTVTLLNNGISDTAQPHPAGTDGAYWVVLSNEPYNNHWTDGDPIGVDVVYETEGDRYYGSDTGVIDESQGGTLFNISLEASQGCPSPPLNPSPVDGAGNVGLSPSLSVDVSDPNGDPMTVRFYDNATDSLIDSVSLTGNGTAGVTWDGLDYGTTYRWYATADDAECPTPVSSSVWQFTTLSNSPPNTPTLSGPDNGSVGTSYSFSAVATDPNGDDVSYLFDWDDGTTSGWTASVSSGETVSESHTWNSPGTYDVQVKARDTAGGQSAWSDTRTVTVTREYTLSVNVTPPEGGNVTCTPSDGTYQEGTNVTVSATPSESYRFDAWTGDVNTTAASVTVEMNANKTLTAHFIRKNYTLNVTHVPPGGGSVTLSPAGGIYPYGTTVNVSATPSLGYLFRNWTGGSTATDARIQVNVTSHTNLTAHFEWTDGFNLSLYTGGNLVTIPLNCSPLSTAQGLLQYINSLYPETCTAVSRWDAAAQQWNASVAGGGTNFSLAPGRGYLVNVTADVTVPVNGTPVTNASVDLRQGYNCLGWYTDGCVNASELLAVSGCDNVSILDARNQTWLRYQNASDDDFSVERGDGYMLYFAGVPPERYTLATSVSPNGTGIVSVDPLLDAYAAGTSVTVTAQPAPGYLFDHWGGDTAGSDSRMTLVMNENKSVTAFFRVNTPPNVTMTAPEPDAYVSGTVDVQGTAGDDDGNDTLQEVEIRIDDGPWQPADGLTAWAYGWNATLHADGAHVLAARAYDGHTFSSVVQRTVYVDTSPPVSTVADIAPYTWEDTPVTATVTVDGDDAGSGVAEIRFSYAYSPDNETYGPWQRYDTLQVPWEDRHRAQQWNVSFTAPMGAGWYRFTSVAVDRAGNIEAYAVDAEMHLDMGLTLSFGSPQRGNWIAPSTPVTITAEGTNVDIYYRVLNDGSWTPSPGTGAGTGSNFSLYTGTFALEDIGATDGNATIVFYGTGTSVQQVSCSIDARAPASTCSAVPFLCCERVSLSADAVDTGSGVQAVRLYTRFSLDNDSWGVWTLHAVDTTMPYSFELSGPVGFYEVGMVAVDFMGNAEMRAPERTVRLFSPDLNGDGVVDVVDFVHVTSRWQMAAGEGTYAADVNGDGVVNAPDLSLVDAYWPR